MEETDHWKALRLVPQAVRHNLYVTAVVFDMSTGLPWLSLPPMVLNDLLGTSARHVGKSTAVKMAGNSVEVFRRTKR